LKRVFGLTGPNASGKGEAAAYLRHKGFAVHSLSDILREEAARLGLPADREHLIRLGTELRKAQGAGALAERILSRLGERDVVDSVRNPSEVTVLRRLPYFVLLGVTAPIETRMMRSRLRARPGDPVTLEGLREHERRENTSDPEAQQLDATLRLADHVLDNSGSLDQLHRSLDRLIAGLDAGGA
jgi:dephospho-CoA kinase